jgi:hypothetical protein
MSEGPSYRKIPELVFESCWGCDWFERHMTKSGRNPERLSSCAHPDFTGESDWLAKGRIISNTGSSHTPSWCPFKSTQHQSSRGEQ